MSKGLMWFPLAEGFKDGVNPCLLISASLILLGMLWFKQLGISRNWFWLLLVSMLLSTFVLNCGFVDIVVLSKLFQIVVKCIYVGLTIYVGFKGIAFLKHWYDLLKGKEIPSKSRIQRKHSGLTLTFLIVLTGVFLGLIASIWPLNYYIVVFSAYMSMPGQTLSLGALIFLYTLVSFWFIYLMFWLFCLESRNQRLFNIIAAAVLISASLGGIEIILRKG